MPSSFVASDLKGHRVKCSNGSLCIACICRRKRSVGASAPVVGGAPVDGGVGASAGVGAGIGTPAGAGTGAKTPTGVDIVYSVWVNAGLSGGIVALEDLNKACDLRFSTTPK